MFTFIYSMYHGFRVEVKTTQFPDKHNIIQKINQMIDADDSFVIENGAKKTCSKTYYSSN